MTPRVDDRDPITKVTNWITENVQPTRTIRKNHGGSYRWKHVVEEAIGDYVPEKVLIAGMQRAGIRSQQSTVGPMYFACRPIKPIAVRE